MMLSTIIVSYNTADLTLQAIESVIDEYTRHSIDGEIIVIDNNSKDGSVKKITKLQSKTQILIKIIKNKKNVGFAKANNQGIQKAKGRYIFLLNSDTLVHKNAIQTLLTTFTKYPDNTETSALAGKSEKLDRVGIVSSTLLNKDGSIQPQGGALPNLFNITLWWLWPLPGSILPVRFRYQIQNTSKFQSISPFPIGWIAGTAMMIRKDVIDEIGYLDENIFMYAEDIEFCIRAEKHHWDRVIHPKANITHLGGASSNQVKDEKNKIPRELNATSILGEIRGLLYIWSKHYPTWQLPLVKRMFQVGAMLRILLFGIIQGNVEKKKTYQKIFKEATK